MPHIPMSRSHGAVSLSNSPTLTTTRTHLRQPGQPAEPSSSASSANDSVASAEHTASNSA